MEYGIWLSYNNQEDAFQIPVNPESIEIKESGQGKTYDIAGLGEINVIKAPALTEISFESIFPAQDNYPFIVNNKYVSKSFRTDTGLLVHPYVNYLKKWMETKRPIRFVFTGSTFDINLPVSIEQFEWKEVAGSLGDIEYKLGLKKYVFYAAKKALIVQSSETEKQTVMQTQEPPRPVEKETPKTYTLVSGDSLWKVAKKVLGDGSRWKEIQILNNITDAQLGKLPIGMVLRLP